mgnify:CR=1 FL=1
MRAGGQRVPFSFSSRFAGGAGSNPEELIAAAHAGCFSMEFAARLEQAGFPPHAVRTTARVTVEPRDAGFAITRIHLRCTADVPGVDEETFQRAAEGARTGCPVSKALAAVPEITLDATRDGESARAA